MSIIEQINDALDDENPPAVLAEIATALIDSDNDDGLEEAFRAIKKNSKQPAVASEAIKQCAEKIKNLDDKERRLKFIRPLVSYLGTFSTLQEAFQYIIDDYTTLCEETEHYSNLARFLKERGIDENEEEPKQLEFYLRIGELYLKDRITDQANGMLNKAFTHRFPLTSPKPLLYRYDLLKAEIQVINQNYEMAADIFYQISENYPNEKNNALRRSIIFAISSPPGPKRDVIFNKISTNDAAQLLPIYNLFDRLNKRQIITGEEIEMLYKEVSHEKSIKKEDLTNTMRLHNLSQISYLYSVISVERMSQIIGIPIEDTAEMVEQMIQSGRLKAKIDEPNGMIVYTRDDSSAKEFQIKEFSEAVDALTIEIQKLGK
jgi:26S proteasome regulatory subunit N5